MDDRITWTYLKALDRKPSAEEAGLLRKLYEQEYARYKDNTADAKDLLSIGEKPAPKDLNTGELAAWISVARVVLNLHETITRY